jgi:hypothetical protein
MSKTVRNPNAATHTPSPQMPNWWFSQPTTPWDAPNPNFRPPQAPGSGNSAGPPPGQVPTTPYGDPTPPTGGGNLPTTPWGGPTTTNTPTITPPGGGGGGALTNRPTTTTQTTTTGGGGGFSTSTGGGGTGTQTPTTGGSALPNINTSITPLLTYPEQLTETARNQIVATQAQASDPRWLTKRFASPGRSIDAGTASAAMPFLAQGQFLGNKGYADLSMGDFVANQESLLAGEIAREKEGLGLGNLLARLQEGQTQQQNQLLNPLLMQLLG